MSPGVIDHFQNPRNVGELAPPAITIEVSNPICGDILRLSVLVVDGAISQVRYKVRGCTASIATGSALTELLENRPIAALANVTSQSIEAAVGGLSNESKHAAALARDAVKALASRCR